MKKWRNGKLWLLLGCLAAAVLFLLWGFGVSVRPTVTRYTIENSRLPVSFSGYRIAQVSDLHNADFGSDNALLLELLAKEKPHLIALTGDLIDSRNTDMELALSFVGKAVEIAPVYYVPGNHEARVPEEYRRLKAGLETLGVTVLEDRGVVLSEGEDVIRLIGLSDPNFFSGEDPAGRAEERLSALMGEEDVYTVLLAHRPELFTSYAAWGVDLTLSGHTHGGQVRLPLLGAILAPDQGLLPEYDRGQFELGQSSMVISMGLGNSVLPLRFWCPPEVVVVQLQTL